MSHRSPRRRLGPYCLVFFLLLLLVTVSITPSLVTRQVNQFLQHAFPSGRASFRLIQVNLFQTDVAISFQTAQNPKPALEIASCVIRYRPLALFKGEIDQIELRGVSLTLEASDSGLTCPALESLQPRTSLSHSTQKPNESQPFSLKALDSFPFRIRLIELSGHVTLITPEDEWIFPIDLRTEWPPLHRPTAHNDLRAHIQVHFGTSQIHLIADLVPKSEEISVDFNSTLHPESFPRQLSQLIPPAFSSVTLQPKGKITLHLSDLQHPKYKGVIHLNTEATVDSNPLEFSATLALEGNTESLSYDLHLNNLPSIPILPDFEITPRSLNGTFDFQSHALNAFAHIPIQDRKNESLDFLLETENTSSQSFQTLKSQVPSLLVLPVSTNATVALTNPSLTIQSALPFTSPTNLYTASISCKSFAYYEVPFSRYRATLKPKFQAQNPFQCTAQISQSNQPVNPVNFQVQWNLLNLQGTLQGGVTCSATGPSTTQLTLSLPQQRFSKANLLGETPTEDPFPDWDFEAHVEGTGQFALTPQGPSGNLSVKLTEGKITNQPNELELTGLRANFDLPKLPELTSQSQWVSFNSLQIKKFHLDSGMAIFRMQSPTLWFLDNLILNWCGGKLRSESTRLAPDSKATWFTLHADQIQVAPLLEQFGLGVFSDDASAKSGRLSGTIPIALINREIRIRDGYFHSAPGEQGIIRLKPAPKVLETAQASIQTSLALDALTDFNYNWIRIALNSEKDELLLNFSLDGAPSKPLKYSVQGGEIIRTKHTSTFKGLVLDSNFRIPLNQLLQNILNPPQK